MQKLIAVIIFFLFSTLSLYAQYVNSDSLIIVPGFEMPMTLNEFDSLRFESPETEIVPGQFVLQPHIPSGKILSEFYLPSDGKVISRFGPRNGRMHSGTDIKMNRGDTIFAAYYGTVTRAKYYYGYGNMVVVDHGNSLETGYAHLSGFLVETGDNVVKGQPIGLAGRTGRATTNHLHFEIREGKRAFNPELVFDFENGKVRNETQSAYNLTELHRALTPAGYSVNEATPQHYKVRSGDSLWKISRRYKTSIKTLCALNNLNENSVLRVGMVLKLY
ncbi:LysM domain-containing protein [Mariniphaga anaerophila]|uniref:LysM domain-containing protein n=1 Tax=Mariniphaga anaerophila TaxID=1484053 RepID=A0A1M4YD28_9BACT|nr:M23 family metallopeptidase [Mariniphaga anaerophila]SHF03518.1 LysM domain-containing protein [Mariniphaga anaerophila]